LQPALTSSNNQNKYWLFLSCSTALLILWSATVQRQFQSFRGTQDQTAIVGEDFAIYYTAGKVARQVGDRQLYYPNRREGELSARNLLDSIAPETRWGQTAQSSGFHTTGRFMAPPFTAILMEPLTLMSPQKALLIWRQASTLMLIAALYFILRLSGIAESWPIALVASAGWALALFPFTEMIYQGQVDALMLLLWTLGAYLAQKQQPVWSALSFALATMIKVNPALVCGVFLIRRQWRWLAAYLFWLAVLLGIGTSQLGWQNHLLWARTVAPIISCGVPYFASKSLPTLITNIYLHTVPLETANLPYLPKALCFFNKGLSLALYCGTLFYFWKKNKSASNLVYELAVMGLVILLISPEAFRHHFVVAILPVLYLWMRSRFGTGRTATLHWAVLAFFTLSIGTVFPDYLITRFRNPLLDLSLSAIVPAATMLLVYSSIVVLPHQLGSVTSLPIRRLNFPLKAWRMQGGTR
jgi:Glycosyltransferase family 87